MAGRNEQDELYPSFGPTESVRVVNDRFMIRTQDRHRVVMVSGIVRAQYTVVDRTAEAYAIVSLVEQGWIN